MSQQITIELTEKAQAIIRDLQTLPEWGLAAVARGMDQANKFALAKIQKDHLTGVGPFPVEEHKLGFVSGRLKGASWASKATVSGQTVSSGIGDNVIYAAVHEFGGTIHHEARAGSVRLRLAGHRSGDSQDELLRQNAYAHLAVFASKTHKRVKEVAYQAEAYDQVMPERAPFRTGIQESLPDYGRIVSRELVGAWKARES